MSKNDKLVSPPADEKTAANIDDSTSGSENGAKQSAPKGPGLGPYFRLLRHATPLEHVLRIYGLFAAIAFGAAIPLMTIVFGQVVDDLNSWGSGDTDTASLRRSASRNALLMTYIFLGIFFCTFSSSYAFKFTALRTSAALRQQFIRALLSQDIFFLDACSSGTVSTLISSNAELVEGGLGERATMFTSGCAMLLSAMVIAFMQSWQLTLVVATCIPVSTVAAGIAVTADTKITASLLEIYSRAAGLAEEALSTVKIVTAFGASSKLCLKYDNHLKEASRLGMKQGPVRATIFGVMFLMTYLSYAVAWLYGTHLLVGGDLSSAGKVISVVNALILVSASLNNIAPSLIDLSKASAAAQGLFQIIDRTPTVSSLSVDGKKLDRVSGNLVLRNVSFAYPSRPSIKVLDNLSLEFEAGKTTAIVGPSGSGKSTVLALIARWFEPGAGSILLDNTDIKAINVQWLRSQMGFVQQEPMLFRDTIYQNVLHGLERCDRPIDEADALHRIHEACSQAYADHFIQKLPDQYETTVGDRGDSLSGGQKQRIAIARSIVANPPILLLDEATSALDPQAEKLVQAALDNASKSRTTLIIAHKLSTVMNADKIVVMSGGRVVEQGRHQDLLARNGTYAALVEAQSQQYHQQNMVTSGHALTSTKKVEEETVELDQQPHIDHATTLAEDSRDWSILACLIRICMYQKRVWPFYIITILCSVAAGILPPAQAVVFGKGVVVFQLPLPEEAAQLRTRGFFWGGMYVVVAVGLFVSYAGLAHFSTIAACHVTKAYRSAYFGAMLNQDAAFFERDDNSAGSMVACLSTYPQRIQDLISVNIGFILVFVVTVIASCILALAFNWRLSLVAIFAGFLPLIFSGFLRIRIEAINQNYSAKAYRECARFAGEAAAAMRTVVTLTLEEKIISMYRDKLSGAKHNMTRYYLLSSLFVALTDSLYFAAMALVFWYGMMLVADGKCTIETFFIIFVALIQGGQAAGFMFGFTTHVTKVHGAAADIFRLLDTQAPIQSSSGTPLPLPAPSTPAIAFENVTFSYPTRPHHPALRSLCLVIPRDTHIGIVGASGSGKSTIVALIERFYDPSSGAILVDGITLTELNIHEHRRRIGYVSQSTTLYDGSIRENVLLGIDEMAKPTSGATSLPRSRGNDKATTLTREVDDDRVTSACKAANIHDFIFSLPEGYNTEVGARGLALSGGQRQRIAIARALVRDPHILLFDEATSALDSASERFVQEAIEVAAARGRRSNEGAVEEDEGQGDELNVDDADEVGGWGDMNEKGLHRHSSQRNKGQPRGRTTIVVAHRLSTVRNCDKIFVLHDGAVVEEGSHEELMSLSGGRYFEMVMAQALDKDTRVIG